MSEEKAQEPKKRPGRPRKVAVVQESLEIPVAVAKPKAVPAVEPESAKPTRVRRKAAPVAEVAPAAPEPVVEPIASTPAVRKAGRPRKVVAEAVVQPIEAAPVPVAVPAKSEPAKPRIQYRKPTPMAVPVVPDASVAPAAAVVVVPEPPVQDVAPPSQAPQVGEPAAAAAPREPSQDRGPGPRGRGQRGRGGQNRGGDRGGRRDEGRGPAGRNAGRQGGNPQARRDSRAPQGAPVVANARVEGDSKPGIADDDSGFEVELEESNDPVRSRRRKGRERGGREVDSNINWCTRRWLEQLEKYTHGHDARQRWARGKVYSRRGQVVELEVGPNGVLAKVQGSRPKPYQVRIELNKLRREAWGRVLIAVSGKAHYTARLLAGEMPQEIESIFASSGARLFPTGEHDFRCKCSCPDPMVPCKHVAAVYHAMGVALEQDPFLLFSLRGKSKNQFLQDLRDMRFRAQKGGKQAEYSHEEVAQMTSFWRMGRLTEAAFVHSAYEGSDPTRLLHTLGDPPSSVVRAGMALPVFESTYRQVSEMVHRLPRTL
ncbi:MAG: hypothetical protein RL318_493 [Fibrobacterota bacterium]|jgi:uncharacterized Zn finger protein